MRLRRRCRLWKMWEGERRIGGIFGGAEDGLEFELIGDAFPVCGL